MFWGFITSKGVGQLIKCPARYRHQEYLEMLIKVAIQALPDFDLTFIQDNAPIYKAAPVMDWLRDRCITVLPWPARGRDLN